MHSPAVSHAVGEVVGCPSLQLLVHPCLLHFPPEQPSLDGVEGVGEIIEHDSHSESRGLQVTQGRVQQVDDWVVVRVLAKMNRSDRPRAAFIDNFSLGVGINVYSIHLFLIDEMEQ